MKYLFASDVHGSVPAMKLLSERIAAEKPDAAVFLGDFCGRGEIAAMKRAVAEVSAPIHYISGNCDDDFYIEAYGLKDEGRYFVDVLGERRIYACHGHIHNRSRLPDFLCSGDIFVYGHLHTPFIVEEGGIIFVNDGSMARPRGGAVKTYVIIDDEGIYIKDGEYGEILEKKLF